MRRWAVLVFFENWVSPVNKLGFSNEVSLFLIIKNVKEVGKIQKIEGLKRSVSKHFLGDEWNNTGIC